MPKNLGPRDIDNKGLRGAMKLACANRYGLEHHCAWDGLWTRLDVTLGLWKFLERVGKSPCAVNRHDVVKVSQQRLGTRVARLSSAAVNEVCAALGFLWVAIHPSYFALGRNFFSTGEAATEFRCYVGERCRTTKSLADENSVSTASNSVFFAYISSSRCNAFSPKAGSIDRANSTRPLK